LGGCFALILILELFNFILALADLVGSLSFESILREIVHSEGGTLCFEAAAITIKDMRQFSGTDFEWLA
jgi:hypothetical protein